MDIYVKPAARPVNNLGVYNKEPAVPSQERKIMFSGVEALLAFHKESLLPVFESAVAQLEGSKDSNGETSSNVARAISTVFLSHMAHLKIYVAYMEYALN